MLGLLLLMMVMIVVAGGDCGEYDTGDRRRKREQLDGARWRRLLFRGSPRSCRIGLLGGRDTARWLGCGGSRAVGEGVSFLSSSDGMGGGGAASRREEKNVPWVQT